MGYVASKYSANSDVRNYMVEHNVSQKALATSMNINTVKLNKMLQTELSSADKETVLRHINAIIVAKGGGASEVPPLRLTE